MGVKSFKDLIVWQKAIGLVECVYRTTTTFPKHEVYGLSQQLRRAAVSIPSNIAEGQCRSTTNDFLHFLAMAPGSLAEVETQLVIALRLEYINADRMRDLCDKVNEVGRLLSGLQNSLATSH